MATYKGDVPFSQLLAETMAAASLDDKAAGLLFGVGTNTVNRWRNGRSVPEDEIIPALIEHLGHDEETWARSLRVGRRYSKMPPAELVAQLRALEAEVAELRRQAPGILGTPPGEP